MTDFDAFLEHVASLQDSAEHKRYLVRSDKCFQEWCDEQREREREIAEADAILEQAVAAWPQAGDE